MGTKISLLPSGTIAATDSIPVVKSGVTTKVAASFVTDITNLTSDLAGKAAASHTHAESDITGLTSDLAGKAALSHTHSESEITNLVSDLAAAQVGLPWWPVTIPVVGSSFSWVNQGTATVTDANKISYLSAPTGTQNVRLRQKSQPATPFTVTVAIIADQTTALNSEMGLMLRESSTDKMVAICLRDRDLLSVQRWTGVAAIGTTVVNLANNTTMAFVRPLWLRITHDGTTLSFYWSIDSQNFNLLNSHAKTDSFTTDSNQVGYFCNNRSSGVTIALSVLSWVES